MTEEKYFRLSRYVLKVSENRVGGINPSRELSQSIQV